MMETLPETTDFFFKENWIPNGNCPYDNGELVIVSEWLKDKDGNDIMAAPPKDYYRQCKTCGRKFDAVHHDVIELKERIL